MKHLTNIQKLKHVAQRGQGYFCVVKQYIDEETGEQFALKSLKKEHYPREDYRYRLLREVKLLGDLQECDNIIQLLDHGNDHDKQKLWYLMPFAKHNLHDFIKANNSTLTPTERYDIMSQVINALKFAHGKNILHRDISPNNVLIFYNGKTPVVKVADFGLGKDIDSLSYYTGSSASGYGQILYVSPEQRIQLKDATAQSDVYSLGKLTYFVFTGRDPDNMKPFELSTLVAKATEENPGDRFKNIVEFEGHFESLRELHLNQTLPVEYITLQDVIKSGEKFDLLRMHELLVKGNYVDHVFHDYIQPVNQFLQSKNNLLNYYTYVGNSIRDFVKTYSDRLNECYQTVGWDFREMRTFGELLKEIIILVKDDESRLICLKQLWHLAYESDQWSVQKTIREVLNDKYITKAIETQMAEYIIKSETEVDMKHFSGLTLPIIVKAAIIKSKEAAEKTKAARERRWAEEDTSY
jgi:eukaryotic-like serine/threonine-protein kinase